MKIIIVISILQQKYYIFFYVKLVILKYLQIVLRNNLIRRYVLFIQIIQF